MQVLFRYLKALPRKIYVQSRRKHSQGVRKLESKHEQILLKYQAE